MYYVNTIYCTAIVLISAGAAAAPGAQSICKVNANVMYAIVMPSERWVGGAGQGVGKQYLVVG